ncbi:DUF4275 family protein [Psychrobacillus sp. OK032]|uniref:DUF4275 family protein n=1 Tax=Psychrobacillus sp. OK032 TaxID=1884358 RepID=UPI0008B72D91|nr:DUF4275 family protein [Psychrobacillus sp. OK032]SES13687.1 protein of unknown function [Psychrobacillus sp. OK032]
MRYKELKTLEIPKWGPYLREQWREYFAKHLSTEEQNSIGMDGFLWHLCSWKKVECFEKEVAEAAFKKQLKQKCTIFYQFIDEAYLLENAKTLTIEELPYDQLHMYFGDIYIMDWKGKWTFIMTHETEFGPYFIQKE